MTRALQTISIALLASSVGDPYPPVPRPARNQGASLQSILTQTSQLYLSLYLQLVPLPAVIQTEIVPVVRLPFFAPHSRLRFPPREEFFLCLGFCLLFILPP